MNPNTSGSSQSKTSYSRTTCPDHGSCIFQLDWYLMSSGQGILNKFRLYPTTSCPLATPMSNSGSRVPPTFSIHSQIFTGYPHRLPQGQLLNPSLVHASTSPYYGTNLPVQAQRSVVSSSSSQPIIIPPLLLKQDSFFHWRKCHN